MSAPRLRPGTREETIPALLREIGATRGAEVGVEAGRYSEILCQRVPGLSLLCVDAWRAYPGYREHVSQEKLDALHDEAVARLAPYPDARIVRGWSTAVAQTVADRSLDTVYIDGNHRLEHVIADLAAWTPKVRPGGIVAGHDYRRDEKRGGLFHVMPALQAWTDAYRIAEWYVLTGERSPSWYWYA